MAFTLPNPNVPTNGQTGDATPILQNELAIAQAISSFDGSQIQSQTVVESALANAVNPRLRGSETLANFVYTGCVWNTLGGLNATMTGGTVYVTGYRTLVSAIASQAFAINSDVYVDIDYLGNVTFNAVSNGAASPSLAANSIRDAKVVTNGSAVVSITQVGSDSLGNIIYPISSDSTAKLQNPYKFSVYRNTALTSGNNVAQLVPFDTKNFDSGANVDVVTNKGRFTAPVAGYYFFTSRVAVVSGSPTFAQMTIYKNGVAEKQGVQENGASGITIFACGVSGFLELAAGDYIEIYFWTSAALTIDVGKSVCYFDGFMQSAT